MPSWYGSGEAQTPFDMLLVSSKGVEPWLSLIILQSDAARDFEVYKVDVDFAAGG
jgi:hypothetical protein